MKSEFSPKYFRKTLKHKTSRKSFKLEQSCFMRKDVRTDTETRRS